MKYSQHKLAKAKMYMTEEDKKVLNEELEKGELSSATKSRLDSLLYFLQPRRLKTGKGCFGSIGLNRKEKKRIALQQMIAQMKEQQKEADSQE